MVSQMWVLHETLASHLAAHYVWTCTQQVASAPKPLINDELIHCLMLVVVYTSRAPDTTSNSYDTCMFAQTI